MSNLLIPPTRSIRLISAEHVRAAWSYINHKDNAAKYDADEIKTIKNRIKKAAAKYDVEIRRRISKGYVS
jgi:hypothetical protein